MKMNEGICRDCGKAINAAEFPDFISDEKKGRAKRCAHCVAVAMFELIDGVPPEPGDKSPCHHCRCEIEYNSEFQWEHCVPRQGHDAEPLRWSIP